MVGWCVALVVIAVGLVLAYYALTSQSTAKASVLFTTTCAFGMTVSWTGGSGSHFGVTGILKQREDGLLREYIMVHSKIRFYLLQDGCT